MEILTNIQKQQEFNKKKEEEIMNVFVKLKILHLFFFKIPEN